VRAVFKVLWWAIALVNIATSLAIMFTDYMPSVQSIAVTAFIASGLVFMREAQES